MRAKGMGANVIVTEVKATAALKATLEGFRVMTMDEAAKVGDIFITATGMKDILVKRHFESMKDGAVICNTGHYDCEINIEDLNALTEGNVRQVRANNQEYKLPDGRRLYVLAQGRLVNLAAAEGHPSEVMDMSFANQFLALKNLAEKGKGLEKKVYTLPPEQDQDVASIKLNTMGISIDALSDDQIKYADRLLSRNVVPTAAAVNSVRGEGPNRWGTDAPSSFVRAIDTDTQTALKREISPTIHRTRQSVSSGGQLRAFPSLLSATTPNTSWPPW